MKTLIFWLFGIFAMSAIGHAAKFDGKDDKAKSQIQPVCFCKMPDPLQQDAGYAEALKYAPILWFADDEQYFPTLPFFSALDGIDNDGDGEMDFADRDEIAPFDPAAKDFSKASWDSLKKWYDALDLSNRRKMTAVFYRIRTTTSNQIKNILANDEQYWRRLEKKIQADPDLKKYFDLKNEIAVYEYYFYYVNDEGLQGHANDMERVFVFVADDAPQPFRIVVGDGHGGAVPNNVLVYTKNNGQGFSSPQYKNHLHVLIELGGHSIAPDFKGDGRFDPVVDANWHSENLWGTRDVQAKVGGGATGKYAPWMTFQRDSLSKVFPPDDSLDLPASHFCYRLLPAAKFKNFYSLLATDSLRFAFINKMSYKSSDLSGLVQQVGYQKNQSRRDSRAGNRIDDRLNFLNDVALGYSPSNSIDKLSRHPGPPPIRFWAKDLLRDLRTLGIPTHRPRGFALLAQVEKDIYPTLQIAWLIDPKISNGVLELQAGTTISKINRRYPEFSALYDLSYGKPISLYGKIAWWHERPATSDVTAGIGLSLVPPTYILEIRPPDFFRHFRFRAGLRTGFNENKKLVSKLEMQLGWWYQLPIAFPNSYKKIKSHKHQIWKHASYNEEPIDLFKPHLFRPRNWKKVGIGFWTRWELSQQTRLLKPEPRLSVIVPAWDFVPVKLDGILEIHAWWKDPLSKNLTLRKFIKDFERQKWMLAIYYDRYYASRLSWYANVAWINNLTPEAKFSAGGGVSITPPPLFGVPSVRELDMPYWFKIRFGFRSDFDRQTGHLAQHRLELQLGLHY
jgi:hypothetical protein